MRKNVASQVVAFGMNSATDGSATTSGTPTVYYTIDGGAQGTGAGTSTHEGNGQWSYVPAQAETNGDHVAFTMAISGSISQTVNVYPVSYDYTDGDDLGLTALTGHTPQTGDTYALANGATGFAAIDTVVDAILVDTGTTLPATLATIAGYLDTEIAAILVDTGTTIPGLIATAQADLDIITGADGVNLLTATQASIDAIETDTSTTLQAELDAIQAAVITNAAGVDIAADIIALKAETALIVADTNELQTDWVDGGRLDLLLDAIPTTAMRGTDNAATEAKQDIIDANVDILKLGIVTGTVDTVTNTHTPTTTEFQADDITEATADHFIGRIVTFTSGALLNQSTDITDYAAVGGIGQFTVTAMTEAPANNDTFKIT